MNEEVENQEEELEIDLPPEEDEIVEEVEETLDDIYTTLESLLTMDDQGERSVALVTIIDAMKQRDTQIAELNGSSAQLAEQVESLKAHNAKLFLSVGASTEVVEEEVEEDNPLEDNSIFED